MKKLLFFGLSFLIATTLFAEEKPYRILVSMPLSGPMAVIGASGRNGAELAKDVLSEKYPGKFEVVIEDDSMDAARAVANYQRIKAEKKVDAVAVFMSGTALALVPHTDRDSVPMMAVGSDTAISKRGKMSFLYWVIPEIEGAILSDFLVAEKVKKIALVTLIHNGFLAARDGFLAEVKNKNLVVIENEEVPGDLQDFRSVLAKWRKNKEIDAVLPILAPGQLAAFVKQLRQQGISAPLYGLETFEDKNEVVASNGLLVGGKYATGADPTPSFLERYKKKFGDVSYYTSCNVYDSILLLAEAALQNASAEVVVANLKNIKEYPGACGTVSSTNDKRFTLPAVLKIVEKDGFRVIDSK